MTIAKNSRTKSEIIACTTDDQTETLYTCPANAKAHMSLLFITNAASQDSDVDIQWYRASESTSFFIIGGKNLSTGEFLKFDGSFIVLESGDRIDVTPSSTGGGADPQIDAFCTVEEFFNPVGG